MRLTKPSRLFDCSSRKVRSHALGKSPLVLALASFLLTTAAAAQDPALVAKAQSGDPAAQNSLGDYYSALNSPEGYTQSASWYRKAADQGYPKAQYSLGIAYCWHEGVPQDYVQAYVWLDIAIAGKVDDQNHWLNYAASHLTADQISQAEEQAKKWLQAHSEKTAP